MFTFTPASLTFLPPGILSHVYLGIQPSVKTGIQDFFSGPESLLQVNCLSRAGQVHIQRSLPATTTLWFPGYEPRTVGDRGQQTRTNAFYPHWQFFTLSCPHLPLHNPAPLFPSVPCCDVQPLHSLPPLQCLPCRWSLNFATVHQELPLRHGKQRKISWSFVSHDILEISMARLSGRKCWKASNRHAA